MAVSKTNAMRILDAKKIPYELFTYTNDDGNIDGISVAQKIGKDHRMVYKTLVASGLSKNLFVYIIPVSEELDLKKAAKVANEKKVDLVPVKEILNLTGYIRGGCSPVGMKKLYPTFIDQSAQDIPQIIVSGGKIGIQLQIEVSQLVSITNAKLVELIK
ncbi:Cys-tRNA(Pro) deacylase [Bacillus sp. RG28]|uniref:Cys-tRNA(Pro)/Cys-tRNA(Cys) deacylase n=1 Tax=Gottfriedia endophytica TaxID=2820819 RepID=A0A940NQT5_9BACI|nr:Cys-tRNA(Pro) deacylase [Gottfriedia endophytica]MBP0725858.1 Cys-tRNA(Pro) deacylase [Gottfriedia endophytica]